MKAVKISEHVWSLKTWLLFPVHVWLVKDEEGITLVDAGFPIMAKGIKKALSEMDAGPLKRILLTHGHGDHVGAVQAILTEFEVPVFAHEVEIPFLQGDQIYPRRKKLERNLPKGLVKPLLTDDNGSLTMVEGLRPYFTPGHSPGHVVYYHEEDQVLLAGDLFTSKDGKLRPPMKMFTSDMETAYKSSAIVRDLNPLRLEVCHGNAVMNPAEQIDDYLQSYSSIAEKTAL